MMDWALYNTQETTKRSHNLKLFPLTPQMGPLPLLILLNSSFPRISIVTVVIRQEAFSASHDSTTNSVEEKWRCHADCTFLDRQSFSYVKVTP
jgi:flagellar biosynthesis protein FliP